MIESGQLSQEQWRDMVEKLIAQMTQQMAENVLLKHRIKELQAQLAKDKEAP